MLEKILARQKARVEQDKRKTPSLVVVAAAEKAPPPRDFLRALIAAEANGRRPLIGEIKKQSPSKGLLRADFDPARLAAEYQRAGAACLSVLTNEEFFGGRDEDLQSARAACELPVLRKDFVVDERQIFEARALGADAVLLIAAALPGKKIRSFAACANQLGMGAIIEIHDRAELPKIPPAQDGQKIAVGINNRNLRTFAESIETAIELLPLVKARGFVALAESAIRAADDVRKLKDAGADGFLIGEAFMKSDNIQKTAAALFAAQ